MKSKKGSMRICGVLFMGSLLANIVMGSMLAGCETLGLATKSRDEASFTQLKEVAKSLGVKVEQQREPVDVAMAIKRVIDKSVKVPERLPDKSARAILLVLDEGDKDCFLNQKAFIESLQGNRVLVLPGK